MDASARYIPNEFSDYKGQLNEEGVHKQIRQQIVNLVGVLERNYRPDNDFTVYTGTAGVALMYFQLYMKMVDDSDRDSYLHKAKEMIEVSLKHLRRDDVTFLCGSGGVLAVGAVVYRHCEMDKKSDECIKLLLDLHKKVIGRSSLPDELLYGRVGYVYCLLFISHHIHHAIDHQFVQKLMAEVVGEVLERGEGYARQKSHAWPLLYSWYDTIYLGAAHGLMGILHTIMMAGDKDKQQSVIIKMLDHLMLLAFPSGNYPAALEARPTDELVHWCHGAPGWVFTFIRAYQLYKQPKHLEAARQCGEVVWRRGLLRKGYGICHGVAGNAYTFLALYNLTKEDKHLHRAFKFAQFTFDYGKHGCRQPDTPYSLFEGMAGTIYFLADMLDPSNARFPAYDL